MLVWTHPRITGQVTQGWCWEDAYRKAASRERLSNAPGWVQTIKCADLISNSASIMVNDPKFGRLYLQEGLLLLDVLASANAGLRDLAYSRCRQVLN